MIDFERLAAWMDDHGLPGKGEPIEHRFLSGGSQNEIYEIRRGDDVCVIRIPPPTAPATRDEGILREWRIIEALDGTDVPHTAAVAMCDDASVLGRSFYLMGLVDGWSPMNMGRDDDEAKVGAPNRAWPAPFDTDLEARAGLAYQLVEGTALLSKVDWQAKGLQDLGRPDGFHERQVDRWTAFLERIKGRELPGFDDAAAWLRAHRPIDYIPGIMHGDYQFANVMYQHGAPARWPRSSTGRWAPSVTRSSTSPGWSRAGPRTPSAPEAAESGYVDMHGMPSRDQVLAHYSKVSGRQVDDIDYYVILAKWKLAVVLEQGFQRAATTRSSRRSARSCSTS